MPQLNWIEQFTITAVVTILEGLESKVTNSTEKAALQAAIVFLQSLLSSQTKKLVLTLA